MNYNSFGELLKSLRLEKGWSQEEACKGVCDRRTYIRWEKNESEPSLYYFHRLSNHFNCDIQAYYKFFICDGTLVARKYKDKAERYITNNEWQLLHAHIEEMKTLNDFSFGENKMTLLYYEALYYFEYLKDYNTSMEYSINGLKEEDDTFSIENLDGKIYSNIGLCLLNCLSCNLNKLNDSQKSTTIYLKIIDSIDNKLIPDLTYYQSTEFEKKLYQTIIHNLCQNYERDNDIFTSLKYANKGIEFSLKHDYLNKLADLFEIKFKILYALLNYEDSRKAYDSCINLYLVQNRMDEYLYCKDIIHTEYTELKKYKSD